MAASPNVSHSSVIGKSAINKTGVLTLHGYGIRVRMQSGHLEIEDGVGPDRRKIRLARVGHGIKRLVLVGSDGYVTLEALRWLADPGLADTRSRDTQIVRLPRAGLPSGSLILVFSPLLDRRLVETLRDLRERGFSVLIIDVLNAEPSGRRDSLSGLARRIWRMERQAIRFSLRELGIPLVHWDGEQTLDEPLAPYTRRVMVSRR